VPIFTSDVTVFAVVGTPCRLRSLLCKGSLVATAFLSKNLVSAVRIFHELNNLQCPVFEWLFIFIFLWYVVVISLKAVFTNTQVLYCIAYLYIPVLSVVFLVRIYEYNMNIIGNDTFTTQLSYTFLHSPKPNINLITKL